MRNYLSLVVFPVLFAACTPPSGWACAASTAVVADNVSTAYVGDWGRWDGRARETNPYLGPTPSVPVLALDAAAKLAAIYAIDRAAPKWARAPLSMAVMFVETWAVFTNVNRGSVPGAIRR